MYRECEPWEEVTRTHYAQSTCTYHHSIFAREFVKAGRVGLTLVAGTILLVATVEDLEVVAINSVANKDIGDEFQNCGLADTSLPNKEDGIWCLNLVLRCLDDPLLERLYIARNYGQNRCTKIVIVTYLIVGALSLSSSSGAPLRMSTKEVWSLEDRPSQWISRFSAVSWHDSQPGHGLNGGLRCFERHNGQSGG